MTKRLIFLALLLLPIAAWAQGNTVIKTATGAPTGSCGVVQQYIDKSNGDFYTCNTSTNAWQLSASHAAICDSSGNCTISGNVVVSGTLTVGSSLTAASGNVTGPLCSGAGQVKSGTTNLYTFVKASAGNLVAATTTDTSSTELQVVTADNTICATTLDASHIYTARAGDPVTVKADAVGLTDGHLFGLSGVTATTAIDCGTNAAGGQTCPVAYGIVKNGGAVSANANFTGIWTGPVVAPVTLKVFMSQLTNRSGVLGGPTAANKARFWAVYIPNDWTFSKIQYNVTTADSTGGHSYAISLYRCTTSTGDYASNTTSETAAATTGDVGIASGNWATSIHEVALTGSSSGKAGWYVLALGTGSSTPTAVLGGETAANGYFPFNSLTLGDQTITYSSGNPSTITCPTAAWPTGTQLWWGGRY